MWPPLQWIARPSPTASSWTLFVIIPNGSATDVPKLFADPDYLSHWQAPDRLGGQMGAQQPVTRVSWFAARAYCEAAGRRLPTWSEWELVAAADETVSDARHDQAWRERILSWYAKPAGQPLADVGVRS